MARNKQEEARYIANFLSNLAVIGFGLALFERRWGLISLAFPILLYGLVILRKVEK